MDSTFDQVRTAGMAFLDRRGIGALAALQAIVARYVPAGAKARLQNVPAENRAALVAELNA